MPISIGDAMLNLGVDTKDMDRGLDQVGKNIKKGVDKWKNQLKIAGAAFTAVGAASLKFVADARKMNASLGQTALTLGATTGELRSLALAVTNVTFPLESVTRTFEVLARAGIRNKDVMAASATAFDTLGDATGASAEAVAKQLIPAFKLFGLELPKTAAELDSFTWLTKNTTVELSEFSSVMSYVAQYGDELNLTLDDMVAIMAVLESKGKSGSTATKMFRTAVTQAAAGTATLNEALGITNEEVAHFIDEMDAATGITQEYADVANTQYGLMDKLKQKWSEITLQIGSFLTPLEPVLGLMTTLGPVMMIMSTSMGQAAARTVAHTVALIAHKVALVASTIATGVLTAAQWLWNVAMNANPIMLVVTLVALLVAAIVGLAKKFDVVRRVLTTIWDNIVIVFAKAIRLILEKSIKPFLASLAAIIDFGSKIVGFFNREWGKAMKSAADSVRGVLDSAIEWTYRIEENAQAHLEQKDAIELTTKATKEEIRVADEYDKALYGMTSTTQDATVETEDLTQALDEEAGVFSDLKEKVDEAAKALQEWQTEQETAQGRVRGLWQELVIENSELGKLGIRLDDVIRSAIGMGISQDDIARALIQTSGAADQATAMLAALGYVVDDLADSYGNLATQAEKPIAAPTAPTAPTTGVAPEPGAEIMDILSRQAGMPEWYQALTGTLYNLSRDIRLPAELIKNLSDILRETYEAGGEWFAIIQAIEANKAKIWGDLLDKQWKIYGDYVSEWATIKVGIEDVRGILEGMLLPQSFQSGGIVPGVGPRLAVVHGGETITPPGQSVTNTVVVEQLVVREEADIDKIARELFRLQQGRSLIHG